MIVTFHTISGAIYRLDDQAMTWQRLGTKDGDGGSLCRFPHVQLGKRVPLFEVHRTILTTEVERVTFSK